MDHQNSILETSGSSLSISLRDVVAVAFRRRKLVTGFLVAAIAVAIVFALALPKYEGEAKFLVGRERVDPAISPTPEMSTFAMESQPNLTEEDLNSEIEILDSHEMLKNVVLAAKPEDQKTILSYLTGWWGWWATDEEKLEAKIQKLDKNLDIEAAKRSNVIDVTYKNRDPEVVERVLKTLSALYVQKHMEVHKPSGQFAFFEGQTERYHKGLIEAEENLSNFPKKYGVVNPAADRELTLQKLNEFRGSLQATLADIAQTQKQIEKLQQEQQSIPERMTTQSRRSDNPQLFEQLKGTLLQLELKRVDLLTKFQPDYRPVQEVNKQIEDARASIAKEENTPLRDETTDVDPTHQWVRSELAKVDADMVGLRAREVALQDVVARYEAMARDLDKKAIVQGDLMRDAKTQEDSYLLYLRKREEARITDALDERRILNVAMAENPSVPALPKHMPITFGFIGLVLTMIVGTATVWTVDHFDSTLRTPAEVETFVNIPVLAAVPYHNGFHMNGNSRNGHSRNGNGSHNGSHNGNGNGKESYEGTGITLNTETKDKVI
jgi:uncharacterized protein involved in exopolysaccharide biosynthesis